MIQNHRLLFSLLFLLAVPLSASAQDFRPMVLYQGSIEDNPFNLNIHEGVQRFTRETGARCREVVVGTNQKHYLGEVEKMAAKGYSPIFILYGNHVPKLAALAQRFPKTRFVVFDAAEDEPNMHSFTTSEQEGSFLAGALAAMASQSRVIGFVSVADIPIMRRFWCGYVQGAKHIDPNIKVLEGFTGQYPGAWFDGNATSAIAETLMDQGADVVYQAAGGAGPAVLEAAARRGYLGIGVDRNQNGLFPGHVLTSMLKRTDMSMYAALKLAHRGIWRDNIKQLGLAQNAVDLAFDEHNAPLVTPDMRQRLERIKSGIILGSIPVHDYPSDNTCPAAE